MSRHGNRNDYDYGNNDMWNMPVAGRAIAPGKVPTTARLMPRPQLIQRIDKPPASLSTLVQPKRDPVESSVDPFSLHLDTPIQFEQDPAAKPVGDLPAAENSAADTTLATGGDSKAGGEVDTSAPPSAISSLVAEIAAWTKGAYAWARPAVGDPKSDASAQDGAQSSGAATSTGKDPQDEKEDTEKADDANGAGSSADSGDHGGPEVEAAPDSGTTVQHKAEDPADTPTVRQHAARGIGGSGGSLPFHHQIQTSFGRHDIRSVKAHTGGAASRANDKMGSLAYATGSSVAFKGTPDLHTAAHEAAHIVQQRAGVRLKDGVGQQGDEYERHADEVADAVVRGESAEALLDRYAGSGGGSSGGASSGGAIQHKVSAPPNFTLDQDPHWAEFAGKYPSAQSAKQWFDVFGRENVVASEMNSHWDTMQSKVKSAEASLASNLAKAKASGVKIVGDEKLAMVQLRNLLEEAVGAMKALDGVSEKLAQAEGFASLASASQSKFEAEWKKETDNEKKDAIKAKGTAAATSLKNNIKHAVTGAKILFSSGTPWEKAVKGIEYVGTLLVMNAVDDYYSNKAKLAMSPIETGLIQLTNKIQMANDDIVEAFTKVSNSMTNEAKALQEGANTTIKQKLNLASNQVNGISTRPVNGPLREIFTIVENHKVAVDPDATYILKVCRESSLQINQVTIGSDLGSGVGNAAEKVALELAEALSAFVGTESVDGPVGPQTRSIGELKTVTVMARGTRLIVSCTTSAGMFGDEGGMAHITSREALARFPGAAAKVAAADASLKLEQDAQVWAEAFEQWKSKEETNLDSMAEYVATGQHMMVAKQAIAAANQMAGLGSFDLSQIKATKIN